MREPGTRQALPVADAAQVRAEVRLALRGGGWKVACVVALLTVGAAAGLATPAALGALVDVVADGEGVHRVWWLAATIAAGALVAAIANGLGQVGATRLVERVLASTRERMVAKGLALPRPALERAGAGDLVSRAGDDVAVVSDAAHGGAGLAVRRRRGPRGRARPRGHAPLAPPIGPGDLRRRARRHGRTRASPVGVAARHRDRPRLRALSFAR